MISCFRRDVDEICALLGYYTTWSDNYMRRFGTTYRSHLQRPRSPRRSTSWPLKMGPIGYPETSVQN